MLFQKWLNALKNNPKSSRRQHARRKLTTSPVTAAVESLETRELLSAANGVVDFQSQDDAQPTPSLGGNYTFNGQATRIEQSGDTLTFVNENGNASAGTFINSSRIVASDWHLEGSINGDRIEWDNGTSWQSGGQVTASLAGDFTFNGQATRIEQSGNALTFINENGNPSAGTFINSSRVVATDWHLEGSINGGNIIWDNGTTWLGGSQIGNGEVAGGLAPGIGDLFDQDPLQEFPELDDGSFPDIIAANPDLFDQFNPVTPGLSADQGFFDPSIF